jgi:Mg2+-importing ATPase
LGALAVALSVALTPIGRFAGFVPPPTPILVAIAGITVAYLAAAEALKPLAMR